MKRLLEWKQRMLQSPLNRKAQAQAYRGGYPGGKENTYNMYQSYHTADKKQKKSGMANRRSVHNLVQYNSYSSDDEGMSLNILAPRQQVNVIDVMIVSFVWLK